MKKETLVREFRGDVIDEYSFDNIDKDNAITIVNRFDSNGTVSDISAYNTDEYTDHVSANFSNVSSLDQGLSYLDVDDIHFMFNTDNINYSVSISMPYNSVDISYKTKKIPFDFDTMMEELDREFKKKSKTL
jgi:archaellum component FlaF (FlaF/FlaG flagellin family)